MKGIVDMAKKVVIARRAAQNLHRDTRCAEAGKRVYRLPASAIRSSAARCPISGMESGCALLRRVIRGGGEFQDRARRFHPEPVAV
jgi:hypothetical protein